MNKNSNEQKKPAPQPDLDKIAEILDGQAKTKEVNTVDELLVNPELRDLLDTPSEAEFNELKKSIEADGIRDPIVVWKETGEIIDGHTRNKIAKLLDITPPKTERSFPDIEAVRKWMLRNQLGRRNLTPARFEYYIGCLYNSEKQNPEAARTPTEEGKTTAQVIGEQFGVSERTVRRAGDIAKGVDKIAQIRGKIAKSEQLSGTAPKETSYSKEELTAIGKAPNAAVAARALDKIDKIKQAVNQGKVQQKQVAKAAAASPNTYPVAFCHPAYDAIGFSVTTEPKPPLDKEAMVYIAAEDEYLGEAMKLIDRWGLQYEGSFVFTGLTPYEGVYTRVAHTLMVIATKGTVPGPKASSMIGSHVSCKDAEAEMIKIIDKYHPKGGKLDMRIGKQTPNGWAKLVK